MYSIWSWQSTAGMAAPQSQPTLCQFLHHMASILKETYITTWLLILYPSFPCSHLVKRGDGEKGVRESFRTSPFKVSS